MTWNLNRLVTKIQNDQELHAEIFVTPIEITSFINDAIDDAEQLIIDAFSDFFLTFVDFDIIAGDGEIVVPEDMFDFRIRGIYYDLTGFNPDSTATTRWYKIKKLQLERFSSVYKDDYYQYRLTNSSTTGAKIGIYPDFRADVNAKVRLWYIRKAIRLVNDEDILETGIKPQYVLAHAKAAIMAKEGDDMLDTMLGNLALQRDKMISSVARLTDDDEDSYIELDHESLDEAYGGGPFGN